MFICTSMYMYIQKLYINNVGQEKDMRKAERNLLKPGCSDSENCTPTQKRQREDNSENGPAPKKARKSTKGTPTTTKKTPASKYNYKEVCKEGTEIYQGHSNYY